MREVVASALRDIYSHTIHAAQRASSTDGDARTTDWTIELEILEALRATTDFNERIQELRTRLYGKRVEYNVRMQLSYRHDPIRNGYVVEWVGDRNIGSVYFFAPDSKIDHEARKTLERELERHGNWVSVVPDTGDRMSKYLALPDAPEVHAILKQMFGGE